MVEKIGLLILLVGRIYYKFVKFRDVSGGIKFTGSLEKSY